MKTRVHNKSLEMAVWQALKQSKPEVSHHVSITATPSGLVWLRGSVPTPADRLTIQRLVGDVPGVHQVFSNLASKV